MPELVDPNDSLYLPGTFQDETDLEAAKSYATAMMFREWLKEIDVRLDLVWVKEGAVNLQGGRWYIVRRNEGAPNTWWVIQNPDGSYADPGPEHIEKLKQMDSSRRPGAWADYLKRCVEDEKRGEKARAEKHREFREKMEERISHLYDTSVSISAAAKARMDGANVTEAGVVLPGAVDAQVAAAADLAARDVGLPEAHVDDGLGGGGIDDFAVEDGPPPPNRAQRRTRNRALTKPRGRR